MQAIKEATLLFLDFFTAFVVVAMASVQHSVAQSRRGHKQLKACCTHPEKMVHTTKPPDQHHWKTKVSEG